MQGLLSGPPKRHGACCRPRFFPSASLSSRAHVSSLASVHAWVANKLFIPVRSNQPLLLHRAAGPVGEPRGPGVREPGT